MCVKENQNIIVTLYMIIMADLRTKNMLGSMLGVLTQSQGHSVLGQCHTGMHYRLFSSCYMTCDSLHSKYMKRNTMEPTSTK